MENSPEICQTCLGMRHVPTKGEGFKRCPDCFSSNKILSLLELQGWPSAWAEWTPDSFEKKYGARGAETRSLRQVEESILFGPASVPSLHFHGPISIKREAILATYICTVMQGERQIELFDSVELAAGYFEGKRIVKPGPLAFPVFFLGKEIEPKLGIFFLRQIVEQSKRRMIPVCLFTDKSFDEYGSRYEGMRDLIQFANFKSIPIQ